MICKLFAAQEFVIEDIRVEGLERITPGTVFNYLPMQVGDTFDDSRSSEAVRALFKTGFFDDVRLERDGNVLVFIFKERPAIGSIQMTGNEDIKTDDLLENLKQFGFAEGRVFVQAQLDQVEQELQRQYYSFGKYAVKIDSTVTELDNNRVAILIEVSEGVPAKIKKINIVGNTVFEEEDLLDEFELSTPTLFSFFTKNDQYSKQKLSGDLESLRSYYLDRGYLNFSVDSTQVSITPDKKDIYITININEGEQYKVTEVKLAGDYVLPEEDLFKLILVSSGNLFSRKEVTNSSKALTDRLGEEGYSFANVNSIPDINKDEKTVAITFFVDPGKRVYVRRITFTGNSKTKDEVLRREMRQQEGAWISTKQVERGKQRLQRTGYFKDVNVETPAVPGTTDQVDVLYTVEEAPGGRLGAGLGFSPGQGIIFTTSIIQENFLGSGKRISFDFNNSDVNTRYGLGYLDPYFTIDGISQGFNAFYRETDAVDANLAIYETRDIGGDINFGYPVTENNSIAFAVEYKNTEIDLLNGSGTQIQDFVNQNGDNFDIFSLRAGFSYDTTNKRILPDKGTLHRINGEFAIPTFSNSLEYYKLNYETKWFKDIYEDFILSLGGEFGYGDGYSDTTELPFFENFFAGGPRSVRGFEANTLGPLDSTGRPLGGDTKIIGKAEVILPVPFLSDFKKSVRVTTFVDAGNVYGPDEDIELDEIRVSTGLGAIWISPFGAVSVNFAVPLNDKSTDQVENFQFTFGTSF
ncbi:MAG: outer membrane protein assembly factor BamA [Proteobacteria bacterium]|nr:outer membrane protein assembly factor BamA [Pseudomonadota bacterium]